MRTLVVHPSGLMYSEIFLRLIGVLDPAASTAPGNHRPQIPADSG